MSTHRTIPAVDVPSTRDRVVDHVRRLIESGGLTPGDRLPGERDLAQELGVSRPSVRSGLEALESMGVVVSRRGAGTFIAEGPPDLGVEPLSLLASLHHFTPNEMFEAPRVMFSPNVSRIAAIVSSVTTTACGSAPTVIASGSTTRSSSGSSYSP